VLKKLLVGLALCLSSHVAEAGDLSKRLAKLSESELEDMASFVLGNTAFIMFHESGHMLIDELDLPVLGKEEDSVDAMSSVLLLNLEDDFFNQAMKDAAMGWYLSDADSAVNGYAPVFWGKHGLDKQRAYNLACYMVGKDPEKFGRFADILKLPKSRQKSCAGDFGDLSKGWEQVLTPHMREGEGPSPFTISYENVDDADLEIFQAMMKKGDILSLIDVTVNTLVKLDDGIKLTAKTCGEENAYWSKGNREITYCYEFMAFHAKLYMDYYID
jgi:Putative metallopeptidase